MLLAVAAAAALAADPANLNGPYLVSPTPNGAKAQPKFASSFAAYGKGVKYFDAYSAPFETLYSQVWWAGLPPLPLPKEVVDEFEGGKVMAVVGFEVDQVIRGPDGVDTSVPISAAYNHHYSGTLNNGHKSRLEKLRAGDPRISELERDMGHGAGFEPYRAVEHAPGVELGPGRGKAPTSLILGGGNGGEYRKSFHGYAPGYAQIIESPSEIQITPMQIDTWHRDAMNISANSPFVSGPVPRNSLSPTTGPDAQYSGLLECPLTTRITKDIDSGYDVMGGGHCPHQIQTAAECFSAVTKALGPALAKDARHTIVDTPATQVRGCSVARNGSHGLEILFNTAAVSNVSCGSQVARMSGSSTAPSLITVRVSHDLRASTTTITLVGPAAVWYGVGFGLSVMKGSWAVIVEGNGTVSERLLGDHVVGEQLPPSITVRSNTVQSGNRTVVLTRPMHGPHFSFSAAGAVLPLINAIGSGPALACESLSP